MNTVNITLVSPNISALRLYGGDLIKSAWLSALRFYDNNVTNIEFNLFKIVY
jgi:hypothetical protein